MHAQDLEAGDANAMGREYVAQIQRKSGDQHLIHPMRAKKVPDHSFHEFPKTSFRFGQLLGDSAKEWVSCPWRRLHGRHVIVVLKDEKS